MKNQNILIEKKAHCRFHDWIQSINYEGRNKWHVCNILIKEEY